MNFKLAFAAAMRLHLLSRPVFRHALPTSSSPVSNAGAAVVAREVHQPIRIAASQHGPTRLVTSATPSSDRSSRPIGHIRRPISFPKACCPMPTAAHERRFPTHGCGEPHPGHAALP
jgi:hypothetical protein